MAQTSINIRINEVVWESRIPFESSRDIPNEETRRAVEEVRKGIGLSRSFSSVRELMEDLNAAD